MIPIGPTRPFAPAHAALIVFIVAALARAWCYWAAPLMITNDGAGYLAWALTIGRGEHPQFPAYRTPGYPYFLAALIRVFGERPEPVLVAQHLMGALACAGLAWLM